MSVKLAKANDDENPVRSTTAWVWGARARFPTVSRIGRWIMHNLEARQKQRWSQSTIYALRNRSIYPTAQPRTLLNAYPSTDSSRFRCILQRSRHANE